MRSNALLKWLMLPALALVIFVAIQWARRPELVSAPSPSSPGARGTQLTPEEMKAIGVDGDTPRDTVATLVAQVRQLRSELKTALEDNRQQKAENERLRVRDQSIDQRIQSTLSAERERWRQTQEQLAVDQEQTRNVLQDLKRRLEGIGSSSTHADLPVGLGLDERDAQDSTEAPIKWIEPQDTRPTSRTTSSLSAGETNVGNAFATSFEPEDGADRSTAQVETDARRSARKEPVYTVPASATLMGSIAMTALIGRVPIDGTVNDPFPFKVLVGPDNLTANGIELPHVAGAVVSGTASGDWTLSCVRGQIRSVTFVFQDGTIRTATADASGSNNTGRISQGLGWISDPYGIPCVSGERRSNAREYLGSQLLITAAGAGAASLIDSSSSVSYINGANGTSLGTVGISGNEAMERILAGGVHEMSQWVAKLYGEAFASVYVAPGAKVAVHIDQPLEIDYESAGRKVNHQMENAHGSDLD